MAWLVVAAARRGTTIKVKLPILLGWEKGASFMSSWSGERGLLFGSPLYLVYGIHSLWARVVSYYTRLFVNLTLRVV